MRSARNACGFEESEECELAASASLASGDASPFLRGHTANVGTPGYTAPEAARFKSHYDSELADVFTVGIVAFLMVLPTAPFPHGHASLSDQGADELLWSQWAAWGAKFSDTMKVFLNCLWRKDPQKRPRFTDLQAVMASDEVALK